MLCLFFRFRVYVFGQNENKTKHRTFSFIKRRASCVVVSMQLYANDDWKHHNKRVKWFINFKLKDLLLLDWNLRNIYFCFKRKKMIFVQIKIWHIIFIDKKQVVIQFVGIFLRIVWKSSIYVLDLFIQIFCLENLFKICVKNYEKKHSKTYWFCVL